MKSKIILELAPSEAIFLVQRMIALEKFYNKKTNKNEIQTLIPYATELSKSIPNYRWMDYSIALED